LTLTANVGVSVGSFVNFVWVTVGENFERSYLNDSEDSMHAGKELKPTGMVIR